MKFFLLLLLLCGLFACNINQSDFLYNNTVSVQPRKSTPITSISEIEATGLKDFNNREIKYVYKIFVDSSSNQEILLKKMYQLQRKIKFPFTRPLREPKNGRYAFVMENDVSVFDRLSQTIIGLKEDRFISVFRVYFRCR